MSTESRSQPWALLAGLALLIGPASISLAGDSEFREAWLRRLSDRDYHVREAATRELKRMGPAALPICFAAVASDRPEVASRGHRVLRALEESLEPTQQTLDVLDRLNDPSQPEVDASVSRLFGELRRRKRREAAERRVQELVVGIERQQLDTLECERLAKLNAEDMCFETAIAHNRVAIRQRARLAPGENARYEAELWERHEKAGQSADLQLLRVQEQATLATCLVLLDADVPDEAERLLERLFVGWTVPRFHGDLDRGKVVARLLVHPLASIPPADALPRIAGVWDGKDVSELLLKHAAHRAEDGRFDGARRIVETVQTLGLPDHRFDEPPQRLLEKIDRMAKATLAARAEPPGENP